MSQLIAMEIQTNRILVDLERRELLALRAAHEVRVICAEGELWITEHGSLDDRVLGPGCSVWLEKRPGVTLIQALRRAHILLECSRLELRNPAYRALHRLGLSGLI
jgi:hypothetical protein